MGTRMQFRKLAKRGYPKLNYPLMAARNKWKGDQTKKRGRAQRLTANDWKVNSESGIAGGRKAKWSWLMILEESMWLRPSVTHIPVKGTGRSAAFRARLGGNKKGKRDPWESRGFFLHSVLLKSVPHNLKFLVCERKLRAAKWCLQLGFMLL